jgi:hypothetical protein
MAKWTSYFVTNPRVVYNLAAVCALSEANFATFVHSSIRSIAQHKHREQ